MGRRFDRGRKLKTRRWHGRVECLKLIMVGVKLLLIKIVFLNINIKAVLFSLNRK